MSLIENLRKFINIIDQLRDIGLDQHIQLPRIVVLGSQSSGKSSLLESIVGIDFLPRGDGLVTRRPLEMRLINVTAEKAPKPYAVFEEVKGKQFTDFEKVRETIIELTDKVAGTTKNIVNIPIIVTIYSSTCPDLTLVDLPGITRIPLHNSGQPDNIEEITKNMALHYVKEPRTIILAVMPANADLSTSDALKMAREIDPSGSRTLGVLTKIDIMDRGTSAKKILLNQEISLNLGYVGVKLRSQQDILDKTPIQKALQEEKNFFSTHNVYSTIPQGCLGIQNLTDKLTKLLYSHIRNHLPNIVKEIQGKIKDCDSSLFDLGPSVPVTDGEKFQMVYEMIQVFSQAFQNSISGKFQGNIRQESAPEGSKFREQFNIIYEDLLNLKSTQEYSDYDIKKAILLHEGDQLPGFQSMDAFYYLLQPQLQKLWDPAFDCLEFAHRSLESLSIRLLSKQIARFPALNQDLEDRIIQMLNNQKEKCRLIIENVLQSEIGYLFTNDNKDFNKFLENFDNNIDPKQELILQMRNKIDQYFKISLRGLRDLIPKIIGNFYIRWFQDKMQMEMTQFLNQNQEWKQLIDEPSHIVEQRKNLKNQLEILKNAVKVIKKDPDLWNYSYQNKDEEEEVTITNTKPQENQKSYNQQPQQPSKEQVTTTVQSNTTSSSLQRPQTGTSQQQAQKTDILVQKQNQNPSNSLFPEFDTKQQQPKQTVNQHQKAQPQNIINSNKGDLFDFDSFTDKTVDNTFANEKFQQGLKTGVNKGAANYVNQQLPYQNKDGKNPIGEFAGNVAEKAVGNQQVQDMMKNQMKDGIKDQKNKQVDKNNKDDKKGFFGLFN